LRWSGRQLIAITLVPVLCTLLLGGKFHREEDNRVMRLLQRGLSANCWRRALRHRAG
jgi:Cu(I)/Ag(I) efflux system membrane protein CusA/SilA